MERFIVGVLALFSALYINGCGINDITGVSNGNENIAEAIKDQNLSVVNDINTTVIPSDVNVTNIINVDVNISAIDSGYYGDGTFDLPFQMLQANFWLKEGENNFLSPYLYDNCTVRVRTRIYITNIEAENSELLPIEIRTLTNNVFEFDINTSWARMSFSATEDGWITMIGNCLDKPKLYNLSDL